jgi:signal transduction histidine kinase/DNA-binding response OmpR family regulator
VTVHGEPRDLAALETLPWRENGVEFEFALLSYFREGDTRYRSQLVGFDREPTAWTADYRRTYTNLPAREYVFRVWGRDYAGNVSGPVEVAFRIKVAPWKTWWAYLLYAGTAAGAAYAGVRYRIDSLERRGRELEELVARRTAELSDSEQRALEANRAKSVFLANMSHELRTPLNAVLGFAQLMERDPSLTTAQREHVAIIQRSSEHLLGLVDDVLSIAKIEAGRLTLDVRPFDLRFLLEAVERIIRVRAEAKGLEFVAVVESGMPRAVAGDEGKLRQVLVNLLGNAVKFTERGRVALRARWAEEGWGGRAVFEVEDTGPGIAPEELAGLFEPFVQTESGRSAGEGTGLGLVISRQIARLMGGDILVRSAPGRGTTFRVEIGLPAADGAAEASAAPRVVGLAAGAAPPRVLVADDVRENRLLLVKLLSGVGFEVREAADGRDAVAQWEAWRPHAILMDMRMPVMDGREATRMIRSAEGARNEERGASPTEAGGAGPAELVPPATLAPRASRLAPCKIVALTASAFEHEREEILASGADDFVAKPFRERTLFEKLAEHLGLRYLYEEARAEVATDDDGVLTVERLAALPEDLARALRDAVNTGDVEEAVRLTERVRGTDEVLARVLRARIQAYRLDEILSLLQRLEA